MKFNGLAVVVSSADPVPRSMRAGPGFVMLTAREVGKLMQGCTATREKIEADIKRHDRDRLVRLFKEAGR